MSTTVNLPSLELVSVLHTAPANGAPSSSDYFDGELEKVTDLATLAEFINNTLLLILNTLPAGVLAGLLGTSIYSDTANEDALVYDSLTGDPLTVTASLRVLYGMIQTIQTLTTNQGQQVAALQARLSASNQNDISLALQAVTSTLASNSAQLNSLANSLSALQLLVGTEQDIVITTGAVSAGSTGTVTVTWPTAFTDNTYSVSLALEDSTGQMNIRSFAYEAAGAGLTVTVHNNDSSPHTGTLHAIGRANTST